MVNTSRILTVSYGTFSCTLEGFDEPFSTMKSIAEYFRDLAADDRYFGAEPPTPDAEMLHRIAEREIHKRVEARVSENGVVLRQTDDDEDYAAPATLLTNEAGAQAEAARAAETARIAAEQQAARKAAEKAAEDEAARIATENAKAAAARKIAEEEAARRAADAAAIAPDSSPEASPVASVSDKLMRLRAVVEQANAAALPGDFLEDQHAEEYFADETEAFDEVLEDALAEDEGGDSAAISAVLGSLGHPAVMEEPTVAADEAEDPAGVDRMITAWDEDEDKDGANETGEGRLEPVAATAQRDAVTEGRARDEDQTKDAMQDAGAQAKTTSTDHGEPEVAQPPRPIARVIKVRRATAPAQPEPETVDVPGESTLSQDAEADLAAELAAVEREFLAGENRETEQERQRTGQLHTAYGDLGDGEEVDLGDGDEGPLAITPEEAPADRIERRASLRTAFDEQTISETDGAIDRILKKTNSQLESGEASRRHSAIQHLKQAVQATRADRTATDSGTANEDEQDAYRADLAHVVRPRRPGGGDVGGKRPARRLAPLVLVSEQRIDAPTPATAPEPARHVTPVRPHRLGKSNLAVARDIADDADTENDSMIAAASARLAAAHAAAPESARMVDADNDVSTDERGTVADSGIAPLVAGFQAYLDDYRARSHSEIVEAGVAYLIQEVGRAHTSRPQLMSLVLGAMPEMSREESLRAFGQLLRDARITKIKPGVFVLNENSRFYDADA